MKLMIGIAQINPPGYSIVYKRKQAVYLSTVFIKFPTSNIRIINITKSVPRIQKAITIIYFMYHNSASSRYVKTYEGYN